MSETLTSQEMHFVCTSLEASNSVGRNLRTSASQAGFILEAFGALGVDVVVERFSKCVNIKKSYWECRAPCGMVNEVAENPSLARALYELLVALEGGQLSGDQS